MDKPKRGRPPKMQQLTFKLAENTENQENVKMATDVNSVEYHLQNNINVKLMSRKISKSGGYLHDAVPVIDVEQDLGRFIVNGYRVAHTMLIEQDPEVIHFLFILVKDVP